jgi:hypothetical protein
VDLVQSSLDEQAAIATRPKTVASSYKDMSDRTQPKAKDVWTYLVTHGGCVPQACTGGGDWNRFNSFNVEVGLKNVDRWLSYVPFVLVLLLIWALRTYKTGNTKSQHQEIPLSIGFAVYFICILEH